MIEKKSIGNSAMTKQDIPDIVGPKRKDMFFLKIYDS